MRLKKDLILLGIAFFIFALILVKSPKNLTVVGTVSDAYENMHLDELLHHHGDEEHDRRHAQHHHHDKEQDKHAVSVLNFEVKVQTKQGSKMVVLRARASMWVGVGGGGRL